MTDHPDVEIGVLPTGQPYSRIGSGSRVVLSVPSLSFIPEATTSRAAARLWRSWLEPIARNDLTVWDIGRNPSLAPGSTAEDIADDYAAVIRSEWGMAVGVMGFSSGGGYAQWLAIRHPDLVERLVLGFTGHRIAGPHPGARRGHSERATCPLPERQPRRSRQAVRSVGVRVLRGGRVRRCADR